MPHFLGTFFFTSKIEKKKKKKWRKKKKSKSNNIFSKLVIAFNTHPRYFLAVVSLAKRMHTNTNLFFHLSRRRRRRSQIPEAHKFTEFVVPNGNFAIFMSRHHPILFSMHLAAHYTTQAMFIALKNQRHQDHNKKLIFFFLFKKVLCHLVVWFGPSLSNRCLHIPNYWQPIDDYTLPSCFTFIQFSFSF
jgi:hypothetical protein